MSKKTKEVVKTKEPRQALWEAISFWSALEEYPFDEDGRTIRSEKGLRKEALRRAKLVDIEVDRLVSLG